jgi:hypothetical protein
VIGTTRILPLKFLQGSILLPAILLSELDKQVIICSAKPKSVTG